MLLPNKLAETTKLPNKCLFLVLLMGVDDLLYFLLRTHENTRSVVDVLGHDFKHAFHLAVDSQSASYC